MCGPGFYALGFVSGAADLKVVGTQRINGRTGGAPGGHDVGMQRVARDREVRPSSNQIINAVECEKPTVLRPRGEDERQKCPATS